MKKSILMISHSSNKTGGGEDDFQKLMEYFNKKGYIIYSIFPDGYRADYFKSLSYKCLTIPDNIFPFTGFDISKYIMFFYFSIKKIIILLPFLTLIKKKIDVCFVNSSVCLSEIICLNILRMPIVLSVKEIISPEFVRKIIISYYNRSVKVFIVISKLLKDKISCYCDNIKIELIRSSINERDAQTAKKKCELTNEFIILNSGVITPIKNQMLLLKALSKVKTKEHLEIIFLGRIEDYSYYQKLNDYTMTISKENIKVYFVGEVNQIKAFEYENRSSLIVITSKYEGMSLVLAEALFFEKPVISTKTGIAPEVIIDDYNGFLIDDEDDTKLSELIDILVNNKDRREYFCSKQKSVYNNFFNFDYYLKEHERVLFKYD